MAIEMCGLLGCRRTVGLNVLYAVRDVILLHCVRPATRHVNAVTLASASQLVGRGLRKVPGSLRTTMTRVRVFL